MDDKSNEVDNKLSKQMSSLIDLLTTSGKPKLNPEIMKKFKKICRTSDAYVTHAYELLMMHLTKNHAEIRLSTFQMIDELFNRSHAFRLLILQDFQTLMELTVGTDNSLPIPPPKPVAKTMKTETCRSIQQWYKKYKEGYPKLVLGYEFLKANKKVAFAEIQAQMEQERQMKEDTERKLEQARKDKLEKVEREMNDGKSDIELVVTEIENGLELLMPHPENFFIGSTQSQSDILSGVSETSALTSSSSSNEKHTEEKHKQSNDKLIELTKDKSEIQCSSTQEGLNTGIFSNNNSLDNLKVSGSVSTLAKLQLDVPDNLDSRSKTGDLDDEIKLTSNKLNSNVRDKSRTEQTNVDVISDIKESTNTRENSDDDDGDDDDEGEDYEDYMEEMRGGVFTKEHGLLSQTFEITVDMAAGERGLKVTDDNADIVQDVKEKYKLIKSKYLNYVKRWIQVMTDCKASPVDIKVTEALRSRLEEAVRKCLELDIISSSTAKSSTDSDSEDDFEDVPEKEGYEEDIPEHIKLEAFSKATTSKKGKRKSKAKQKRHYWMLPDDNDDDATNDLITIPSSPKKTAGKSKTSGTATIVPKIEPGTSKMNGNTSSSGPSTSKEGLAPSTSTSKDKKMVKGNSKEDLLVKAPVKSFGVDLEHWENPENIQAPLQVKYEGASRFWVPDKEVEESASQDQVAALTMRTMTYTGEFEPVKWKCRAPLSDGRLCERMDRIKCPFHGKIIPRDAVGQPTDPDDIEKLINQDIKQGNHAGSGSSGDTKDKNKGKGKGKGKKRKYPNLTDITVTKNSRQRLEAKVFNRSTLRRVNQCLDAADMKKVTDKFSNQFNYSLK